MFRLIRLRGVVERCLRVVVVAEALLGRLFLVAAVAVLVVKSLRRVAKLLRLLPLQLLLFRSLVAWCCC
jgi:hypothetical protein